MKLNSSATTKVNFVDGMAYFAKDKLYKEIQAYYAWIRSEKEYTQTINKRWQSLICLIK